MQSIKVNIMGKQIPLKVEESEVESTRRIAQFVDEKFRIYRNQLSNQPDSTVMILACLNIAEELFELRSQSEHFENRESELMESINGELEKFIEQIS
jgi:cell division protein ZapA (FtsZ GTPase activity inhibitor)